MSLENNNLNDRLHLRIGLFGGTFNPVHVGHLQVLQSVRNRVGLDKVYVIPAAQNPNKLAIEGPSPEQRLEMLKIGLGGLEFVEIDDQELKRGGVSYSIQTVQSYSKTTAPENLFLIIGLDQLEEFDRWKDFSQILSLCNLIVCSRPGHQMPITAEELPEGLRPLVAEFDRSFIQLNTGRSIEFVRMTDVDVSSNEIRKRLRIGRSVDRHLTIPVEEYIRENKIYGEFKERISNYLEFTQFCAEKLNARKAISVRGFDLRHMDAPTEFTLVASGTSTRHTGALAELLVREVKEEYNVLPQSVEGLSEGRWVLLDYGALIVHVFYDYVRQEYRIEELWKHAKTVPISEETATPT